MLGLFRPSKQHKTCSVRNAAFSFAGSSRSTATASLATASWFAANVALGGARDRAFCTGEAAHSTDSVRGNGKATDAGTSAHFPVTGTDQSGTLCAVGGAWTSAGTAGGAVRTGRSVGGGSGFSPLMLLGLSSEKGSTLPISKLYQMKPGSRCQAVQPIRYSSSSACCA